MPTHNVWLNVQRLSTGITLTGGGTVVDTSTVGAFTVAAVERQTWSLATGTAVTTRTDQVWHSTEDVLVVSETTPGRYLTPEQRDRLVYLIDLENDPTVTQLDTDELADYSRLMARLGNEDDEPPITVTDLIAVARSLRSDVGENTEYDRALVELANEVTGGNSDNVEVMRSRILGN